MRSRKRSPRPAMAGAAAPATKPLSTGDKRRRTRSRAKVHANPYKRPSCRPLAGSLKGTVSGALDYLPIAILGAVAFLLVLLTLLGNKTLGPKRGAATTLPSYGCGEKAPPGARGPIDVQYYMFILTFLVFDVEAMFLVPFALKFKTLGMGATVAIGLFVG